MQIHLKIRQPNTLKNMLSVTSVSGGKTSAYMALNYKTDKYVFACVLSNDLRLQPKDKSLLAYCQSKLPGFVASYEAPETLQALRDLELWLGHKIDWVSAEFALEDFVFNSTDLPNYRSNKPRLYNSHTRFCTIQQKIKPISEYCYLKTGELVLQHIGFRADEPKRVQGWSCKNDKMRFPLSCGMTPDKRWQYQEIEWRISDFPLYRDGITKADIDAYWHNKPIKFPAISNCVMCPLHRDEELAIQAMKYPEHYAIAVEQEALVPGHYFGSRSIVDRVTTPKKSRRKTASCACTD